MTRTLLSAAMLALLAAGTLMSAPASAGTATTLAVDNCNGALPGYEGALRKRALAVANEGTTTAFISCAVTTDESRSTGNTQVAVFAINRAEVPQILSCTFVDGLPPEINLLGTGLPDPVYRSKLIAIPAGEAAAMSWTPSEFSVTAFTRYASVSCSLPPGMEVNVAAAAWGEST